MCTEDAGQHHSGNVQAATGHSMARTEFRVRAIVKHSKQSALVWTGGCSQITGQAKRETHLQAPYSKRAVWKFARPPRVRSTFTLDRAVSSSEVNQVLQVAIFTGIAIPASALSGERIEVVNSLNSSRL